ncbi:MAG: hypothetical protein ABSD76_09455 [Terriglobales bacterium]
MNPLACTKCAGRLLMALAAIFSILLIAGCGSSSSAPTPNSGGFSDSNLSGTYVISMSGTDLDSNGVPVPFAIVGTITANGKGAITGTIDINDPGNTGVNLGQTLGSNSSYNITQDGRGTGTLTTTSAGSFGIDFVLTSNSHGLITRFDPVGTGSGTIDLQTAVTSLTGSYAFSLSGADSGGNPLGTVGAFTLSSNSITGTEDFNDDLTSGDGYTDLTLSGQVVLGASGTSGTAQFNTNAVNGKLASLGFDVWVIDSTHLKFIETDGTLNVLSGDAFTQVTSFAPGQEVFTLAGVDGTGGPIVAGGYATITDANGDLSNGVEDYNDAGNAVLQKPFSTSSSTCAAGRCQSALNGFTNGSGNQLTFVVYPSSGGGLALEIDSFGLLQGAAYSQTATSFTGSGGYALNLSGLNNLNPVTATGVGEVDNIAQFNASAPDTSFSGPINMTGTLDENDIGAPQPTSKLSGIYVPDTNADGRGSISSNNSKTLLTGFTLQYYVVDSSTVVFIDVDSTALDGGAAQVALGTFEAQSSSSGAAHRAISMVRPTVRPHGAATFQRK